MRDDLYELKMELFRSGTFEVLIHEGKVYYRFEYTDDTEFPYSWKLITNKGLVSADNEMKELEQAYKKSFSTQPIIKK